MSADEKNTYELQDDDEPDAGHAPDGSSDAPSAPDKAAEREESTPEVAGGVERSTWEPILMEGEGVTHCPECGAPMPGGEEVLCLRCGFDMTKMEKIRIETGVAEREPTPDEEAAEKPPIVPPGRGGLQLPAIVAGAALLIMSIAYLAGTSGLFTTYAGRFLPADHIGPINVERDFTLGYPGLWKCVGYLIRFYLLTGILAACLWSGLHVIARLERRRVGDSQLALMRTLAVASVTQFGLLFGMNYGWQLVEVIVQFILMAGIYLAVSRFFYRLSLREASLLGGVAIGFVAILLGLAEILT